MGIVEKWNAIIAAAKGEYIGSMEIARLETCALKIDSPKVRRIHERERRIFAMTEWPPGSGRIIVHVQSDIEKLPIENSVAILLHEAGHVASINQREREGIDAESDANDWVLATFCIQIEYADCDGMLLQRIDPKDADYFISPRAARNPRG